MPLTKIKILDKYLLQEALGPFLIGLSVFSFVLIMSWVLRLTDLVIAKGVGLGMVLKLITYLMPSFLVVTIPMAVLLATLVSLGRLSTENEITAMFANGISLYRLLAPYLIVASLIGIINYYMMDQLLPWGNTSFKALKFQLLKSHAAVGIKERTFIDDFHDLIIYVENNRAAEKILEGIFISDLRNTDEPKVIIAKKAELLSEPETMKVILRLHDGVVHETSKSEPGRYSLDLFLDQDITLDLSSPFSQKEKATKGDREMTTAELSERKKEEEFLIEKYSNEITKIQEELKDANKDAVKADLEKKIQDLERTIVFRERSKNRVQVERHKKFSIPAACLIFTIIGFPLGIKTRRGGKSAGFALSLVIILAYYIFLTTGENFGDEGRLPPALAMWLPNLLLGGFGCYLFYCQAKDKLVLGKKVSLLLSVFSGKILSLSLWKQIIKLTKRTEISLSSVGSGRLAAMVRILDYYIIREYLKIFVFVIISLISIYLIVDFFEVLDDIVEHESELYWGFIYLLWHIPMIFLLVVPMAVLLTVLLTLGVFSRNSELIAIKASGLSIPRTCLPICLLVLIICIASFLISEFIAPTTNRMTEIVKREKISKIPPRSAFLQNRIWYYGSNRRFYNFQSVDAKNNRILGVSIFQFDPEFNLIGRIDAREAYPKEVAEGSNFNLETESQAFVKKNEKEKDQKADGNWVLADGTWWRFNEDGTLQDEAYFEKTSLEITEKIQDFIREKKDPEEMTYSELKLYTKKLLQSGYDASEYLVDLDFKIALPLVSFVMVLLGIPFALGKPRRSSLAGIGISIFIGVFYWICVHALLSFGHAGKLPPFLAAWGANLLFFFAAVFLLSRVDT